MKYRIKLVKKIYADGHDETWYIPQRKWMNLFWIGIQNRAYNAKFQYRDDAVKFIKEYKENLEYSKLDYKIKMYLNENGFTK